MVFLSNLLVSKNKFQVRFIKKDFCKAGLDVEFQLTNGKNVASILD